MSLTIEVTLFGDLRRAAGGNYKELDLPDGATVRDVVVGCGLEDRVDIWALVDGRRADRNSTLRNGAQVHLFQPVGGG